MKKTLLTLALALCGALQLLAESPTPAAGSAEFPLGLADIRVRDPFILADQGTYYLYAQGGNRARNDNADLGVEVYLSRDLVHWSQPKQVFARPKEGFWGNPPIWAPEAEACKSFVRRVPMGRLPFSETKRALRRSSVA